MMIHTVAIEAKIIVNASVQDAATSTIYKVVNMDRMERGLTNTSVRKI